MEKQTLTVLVGGKNYTLTSSDPPDYVRRVAAYVDRKLRETAAVTNLPSAQGAVLTCFQLADELLKAQDENRTLRLQMEARNGRREPPFTEERHERRLPVDGMPDGKAEG
ncbi:MAG: cell division protein ZapA [Clostridia bacterium]|nr:cell division protein ZapA [Clostridia bacterium]